MNTSDNCEIALFQLTVTGTVYIDEMRPLMVPVKFPPAKPARFTSISSPTLKFIVGKISIPIVLDVFALAGEKSRRESKKTPTPCTDAIEVAGIGPSIAFVLIVTPV